MPESDLPLPAPRLELLAPAGDRDCLRAAVENGADAVYFGLECGFNARARAANFPPEQLPEIMTFLHQRGVQGYVTLNTLIFPAELAEVEELLRKVVTAGVDAVLVQDLGLVRLIRALCPDLSIHSSTQMTLTSAECIREAASLGVSRVVLARELSLDEIRQIRQQTEMPLEVFVHGALCVAYSGQCLTSESLGGRSANRGQCAQACRLPYELICDGQEVELDEVKYLLSPQDLAAYAMIPELVAAGVTAFKIEGRLKTAEYVANITRHYRRALDESAAGRRAEFGPDDVREMEMSFSRGFSPGWLRGCDHKLLVPGRSSAKRGVFLGEVTGIRGRGVLIRLASPVARGDGVVFSGDRANREEQGGRVYDVRREGTSVDGSVSTGIVELIFDRQSVDIQTLSPGQQIWKTDDPQLAARLRRTFTGLHPIRRVNLDLAITAAVGQPLTLYGRADSGATCTVTSSETLAKAEKHPLTLDQLRSQLGRLGGSNYILRRLEARIEGTPMAPFRLFGPMRQEMIRQLDAAILSRPRELSQASALNALRETLPTVPETVAPTSTPELHLLCRNQAQLQEVLALGIRHVVADYQDIREYGEAVSAARQVGAAIYLAPPRIQKPSEAPLFRALRKHQPDGLLARNLAGIAFCEEHHLPFLVDYSLNATNELTVQYLKERGAQRVTPSYDLNADQLHQLVAAVPPSWLEIVVHQHMPMFHMEHCVFCAVLSPGTNKTNCGRPCDRHEVQLRDRIGMEHPLKADVGCRNTLFNAVPQSAAEIVPWLISAGVKNFRVELLDEPPRDVGLIVENYRRLLSGDLRGKEVWRALQASNRVGVTRGTLEERRNPLAIL